MHISLMSRCLHAPHVGLHAVEFGSNRDEPFLVHVPHDPLPLMLGGFHREAMPESSRGSSRSGDPRTEGSFA